MSAIITQMRREIGIPDSSESWDRVRRELEELEKLPCDNSWIVELAQELSAEVSDEEWAKLPTDLSINHDHYLYGSPKQVEFD